MKNIQDKFTQSVNTAIISSVGIGYETGNMVLMGAGMVLASIAVTSSVVALYEERRKEQMNKKPAFRSIPYKEDFEINYIKIIEK